MKFQDLRVSPAAMATRDAVLHPIAARLGAERTSAIRSAICVLEQWRTRVEELSAPGRFAWATRSVASSAFNCHPSSVRIAGKSFSCRRPDVCPWCYGRRVEQVGDLLGLNDPDLLATQFADRRVSLIEWSVLSPASAGVAALRDRLELASLACSRFCRGAGKQLLGGFWQVTAQPCNGQAIPGAQSGTRTEKGDDAFRVDLKLVAVRRVGGRVLHLLSGWSASAQDNPDYTHVRKTLVNALAYPVEMLAGNPDLAASCLEARAGLRLFCTFGFMRRKSNQTAGGEAGEYDVEEAGCQMELHGCND